MSDEGHNEPCYNCGELCNSLAGNPSLWPTMLPAEQSTRPFHMGCAAKIMRDAERVKELEHEVKSLRGTEEQAIYDRNCTWRYLDEAKRDTERIEWLGRVDLTEYWETVFNTPGPMEFRAAIDAEIARDKERADG